MPIVEGALVLADGAIFEGELIGDWNDRDIATGEVVFNTVLTGYQEVVSDPSYAGQVITFTYPHIGNYGVSPADNEAPRPHCRGVIVRELARRCSNWRAEGDLSSFLEDHALPGIAGIDTRRLTRHIRDEGAMPGAFGAATVPLLRAAAAAEPGTDGVDLAASVTCAEAYSVSAGGPERWRVVAVDYGIKATILDHLSEFADVTVVPAGVTAAEILEFDPHGVFLSNGPGDPAAVTYAPSTIEGLLGELPVFGICLGHQLLARTLGADSFKLPFGHHGGNHPVRNLATERVEITSQNHNYCIADAPINAAEITHRNLNDGTVEGLRGLDVPAFSVQYHPEAGPGPHDSRYLFDEFAEMLADFHGARIGA
jgi:carbamoyl-phosphate synthase small subunit